MNLIVKVSTSIVLSMSFFSSFAQIMPVTCPDPSVVAGIFTNDTITDPKSNIVYSRSLRAIPPGPYFWSSSEINTNANIIQCYYTNVEAKQFFDIISVGEFKARPSTFGSMWFPGRNGNEKCSFPQRRESCLFTISPV